MRKHRGKPPDERFLAVGERHLAKLDGRNTGLRDLCGRGAEGREVRREFPRGDLLRGAATSRTAQRAVRASRTVRAADPSRLLGRRRFVFPLFRERMQRRDLERLVAQHERLQHSSASAHERPVHPTVLLAPRGQVMLFHVDAAVGLPHGHRPVVLAAHHDALDERLAAYVRLQRTVLGERPRQVALLLGHARPFSRAGTGSRRSSCLRGSCRGCRARRRP